MNQIALKWLIQRFLLTFIFCSISVVHATLPEPVVVIPSDVNEYTAIRELQLFLDSEKNLSIQEVTKSKLPFFKSIQKNLSLGFTSDIIWVRFSLARQENTSPTRWWLEIDQPLFRNVKLYRSDKKEQFFEVPPPNPDSLQEHSLDNRAPVFELDLTEPQIYYLRIETQTAVSTQLNVWQPQAFLNKHTTQHFLWGCFYGAYLLIIIFYSAFWCWTRERAHLIYILYVTLNLLISFFSGGWPRQFFPDMGEIFYIKLLGTWIALAAPIATIFTFILLKIEQSKWRWVPKTLITISIFLSPLCIALVINNAYGLAMMIIQSFIALIVLVGMLIGIYRSMQGDKSAQLFLFAFSFFYCGVLWRFLKNAGLLEHNFWSNNAYQFGAFIHMLVMSVGIFSSYSRLRRENQEIEYRLNTESELRQQQAEFLSMVSHEFRTPLSIISSASDNLLIDTELPQRAKGRIEKIVRANNRMTSLMDEYLSYERLVAESTKRNHQLIDLSAVVRKVEIEQRDCEGPEIKFTSATPVLVYGDHELIRVAIQNLVNNAKKYAPAGSMINLETFADQDLGKVIVRDQGPGIADEDKPHIFRKFFRGTHSTGKAGVGLGLHLAQSIVEKHHGMIEHRNLQPMGCEFIISIPLASDPLQASAGDIQVALKS